MFSAPGLPAKWLTVVLTLQVDNWTDCPPKPGCITVNVGDPLQFWSDGLLKSNYHRVRMPKEGEPLVRRCTGRTPPVWGPDVLWVEKSPLSMALFGAVWECGSPKR